MSAYEIIHEISHHPISRRIFIVERTLKSIREKEENDNIEKAVKVLHNDYATNKNLTEFSDIEFDDFYEAR